MGYWEDAKVKPTYKAWVDEYNGSLQCDCGHGCRQWILEQKTKTALILMVAQTKGITSLDKIAQMTPERADKIWMRIIGWQSQRFNRLLREGKL